MKALALTIALLILPAFGHADDSIANPGSVADSAPRSPGGRIKTEQAAAASGECAAWQIQEAARRVVRLKYGNGNSHSRGALGVREALTEAGVPGFAGAIGNAMDYVNRLPKLGFVKLELTDVSRAPTGSIIVFSGPRSEEYLKTGKADRRGDSYGDICIVGSDNFYYNDGRKSSPAIGWNGTSNTEHRRNVAAIFMPSPELEKKFAGKCH